MTRDTARRLALALAWGRVALGGVALVTPRLAARSWIGDESTSGVAVLTRALGARDVAIGLGAVLALRHDAPVRGWIEGGGTADAGDAVATLLGFSALPPARRWAVLAASTGGVVAARVLSPAVDG